jgi:hypothetical protein
MPLVIISAILVILGVSANYYITATIPPEQLARNVLLSALPFILIFVAIVLIFIASIQFASSVLSGRIAGRPYRIIEGVVIFGILFGVFGIFQPWVFALYPVGFVVLFVSTLWFILWSHVQPKRQMIYEE